MTTVIDHEVDVVKEATATIEEAVEVIAEAKVAAWKGNIVNHTLSARVQSIAASLEPLVREDEKGLSATRKDYYKVAEEHGFSPKYIKELEDFNGEYVHAVHAVSSDKALTRFRDDSNAEDYSVKAEIGEHTRYKDNYRRHHEYSVPGGRPGSGAERVMKSEYAHHNPSITTDYKGFAESRTAVHNLARDLLG